MVLLDLVSALAGNVEVPVRRYLEVTRPLSHLKRAVLLQLVFHLVQNHDLVVPPECHIHLLTEIFDLCQKVPLILRQLIGDYAFEAAAFVAEHS